MLRTDAIIFFKHAVPVSLDPSYSLQIGSLISMPLVLAQISPPCANIICFTILRPMICVPLSGSVPLLINSSISPGRPFPEL